MKPASLALKGAVLAYQWTLRPVLGCNCRFYPSCSNYALEAVGAHGALRGTALTARRILRCNPCSTFGTARRTRFPSPRPA
jgi:putative membrane protein insertion efficiency factor